MKKDMEPCVKETKKDKDCSECIFYKIAMQNETVKKIMEYAEKEIESTEDLSKKMSIAFASDALIRAISEK